MDGEGSDWVCGGGQLNLINYVATDPINYVDPTGLKIHLGFHGVAFGAYHGKIVVRPENLGRWAGHPLMVDGKMTFGGGPDSKWSVLGPLIGSPNRGNDQSTPSAECHELRTMFGKSEDEVIEMLIQNTANYQSNPKPSYTLLPWGSSEYNSNSFAHGLGSASGLFMPLVGQIGVNAPGYSNPVPSEMFVPW